MKATETELELWGRITQPQGLEQAASVEEQFQFEHKVKDDTDRLIGKTRIRKIVRKGDNERFTETIKIDVISEKGVRACTEEEAPITEAYYEAWKVLYGTKAVLNGVHKLRYRFESKNVMLTFQGEEFQLPEIVYEVDQFLDGEGRKSKWVKIDIEIDHILSVVRSKYPEAKALDLRVKVTSLPIGLTDVFSGTSNEPQHVKDLAEFFSHFSIKA